MARFTHEKIVMALLGRHVTVIHVSTDFSHFSCLGCILRYTRGYCILYYGQAFVSFGVFCSRNSSLVFQAILAHSRDFWGTSCNWLLPLIAPFDSLLWISPLTTHLFLFNVDAFGRLFVITRLIVYSGGFSLPIAFLFGRDDTILLVSRYHR